MKLKVLLVISFIPLFFPIKTCWAAEIIRDFNSIITINTNGTVDFSEKILYDFGDTQKHGIIRSIPIIKVNVDKKIYKMEFTDLGVFNQLSSPITFSSSIANNNMTLKVGDAAKFVTGQNLYEIRYKVTGAITYFTDHDELYWNITGNETEAPIQKVKSEISIPFQPVNKDEVKAECFTGYSGDKGKDCTVEAIGNKVMAVSTRPLNGREGITVVVGFPKGIVQVVEPKDTGTVKLGFMQRLVSFVVTSTVLAGSFFWFIYYPIKIFLKWLKVRKNTKAKERVVAAWFESPETLDKRSLTPAETGALVDKNVDHKDISATIIDLAQRGFIKIKVDESKQTSLQKLVNYSQSKDLMLFERDLLNGLFINETIEVRKLSHLNSDTLFYKTITKFKEEVSQQLVNNGLYKDNPLKTDTYYSVIGVIALITFNFILAGVAYLLGRKSARRTDLGIEKYSEAISLKNFLISQGEQLNFQSQNQMFFEKLLPYATAFGVENIWAKRFDSLKFVQPDWYEGDVSNIASFYAISNSINSSVRSNISYMTSTRSSSGFSSGFSGGGGSGGHSGGGGGGGGTGSW